jgi:polysaccharide export outer membrane protein
MLRSLRICYRKTLVCGLLAASISGCTSTSGLLMQTGPYKVLPSAETLARRRCQSLEFPRELEKQVLYEYRVEPGDMLVVEPVDFDSTMRLPGDQTVLADGTIELGRYGRLQVADRTIAEIEADVQRRIDEVHRQDDPKPEGSTRISVRLDQAESKIYYVLGEVNAPGAFPLVGRETILDAIVKAGGLADRANRHSILLSRPTPPESCRIVLPVCYKQIVQLGDTTTNYQIQPGDRIFVPSLTFCREMAQCLAPWHAERCPGCQTQPSCSGDNGCDDCL